VVVAALGLVVYQGIANATLYFRHVDEAIEQRAELGDRRFRLQGTVVPASAQALGTGVAFEVTWNGQVASVRHQGDPPELFEDDIPVVLEGNWDGEVFVSDRMMIRHSEEYEAANPERVEPDAP
jgi:cytochrome c-type biogenesis protein CcmE